MVASFADVVYQYQANTAGTATRAMPRIMAAPVLL
jgi:hypothetical protein